MAQPYRSTFNEHDLNGDGILTFIEWAEGTPAKDWEILIQHWLTFDIERKGYLTEEETLKRLG